MTSHVALMPNRLVKNTPGLLPPSPQIAPGDFYIQGVVKRKKGESTFKTTHDTFSSFERGVCEFLTTRFSSTFFYYSEDSIGAENIFLHLNRGRMLIASKLTLFSCQNSSKSFHSAKASCTNRRHLPTGSICFHFMQEPCGSHKLIEVMLTKKTGQ